MRKSRVRYGFTLIELIVVIAVIGIVVGIGTGISKGYTKDALNAQIKNDIKVAENSVTATLVKNNGSMNGDLAEITKAELEAARDSRKLYDLDGIVESDVEFTEYFKILDSTYINSKLKGKFYANAEGKVYYEDIKAGGVTTEPGEVPEDFAVITIDPYNTDPTNEDVTVTATTDKGTLNQDSHTFENNGSFEFIATHNGKETKETVTITNINKILPIITINEYNLEPTNQSIEVTATTDKGTLNQDSYIFESNSSFEFIATDEYGNISKETVTVTNIDKDFPVITISEYNLEPTNKDITVTASTDKGTLNQDSYTFTSNDSFEFVATDALGNITRQIVTITNIDKELPVITINDYIKTATNENITVTASTNKGTLNKDTYLFENNGSFEFIATDEYGNISKKLVTINNIDKTVPVITINAYNTLPTNQNITVTATTSKGTLNKTSNIFTSNGSFEFIATDSMGNVTKKTVTITNIDKIAPTTPTITKSTEDQVQNLTVTINYSADSHIKQYKIGAGSWLNYTSPFSITSVSTIYARAEDNAGNLSSESQLVITNVGHPDDDYSGTTDGTFKYIGTATTVTVPHVIKGVPVTSYKGMFAGTNVTKVISTNTNVTNMDSMFYGNKATTLDVSGLNTSNVTTMVDMFSISSATSITGLTNFNTSKVTTMAKMFDHTNFNSIDISSFNTLNVTNMEYMLAYSKATTITGLNNLNTSKVTNMRWMFASSTIKSLDLSNFNTLNVTNMGGMFNHSAATYINLSSFNTSKVTDMSAMFWNSKVTNIVGLNTFNTSNVYFMAMMFAGCPATTLDLSSFNTRYVSQYDEMFKESAATTLDLSSFDTSFGSSFTNMFQLSKATTGYAKTTADVTRLHKTATKRPTALKFVVK